MVDETLRAPAVELRRPWRRRVAVGGRIRTPALYGAAGASYVAVGVFWTPFMLSWVVGFAWLLVWVWLLPAAVRRLR